MDSRDIASLHFIGIGGVGMSGIASVAHDQGIAVTGSDLKESRYTKQLVAQGIPVAIGQDAANIPDGDPVVVVSTAILANNPELVEAQRRGLRIVHRAQMLAHLGRDLRTLAVAGTHGKTTTSSMLASTLEAMGADPTFLIGGIVRAFGTNAHSGRGPWYVVEADESDKSFTYLAPQAVIVTNIEADHLDHYADLDDIYENFRAFIASVPDDGVAVVCGDDAALADLARSTGRRVVTYGFSEGCDARVTAFEPRGVGSAFTLRLPGGREVAGQVRQNPGAHNVANAAGVLALIDALGMDVDDAAAKLGEFAGVRRRFDLVGQAAGVTVVDDYAHHPTEIAATIRAAKALDFNRVHVLFQPHRYSRAPLFTEVLRDEFGSAFDDADDVVFMDVYPAGEAPVPGVNGKTFLNVVLDHPGHPDAAFVPRRVDVVPALVDAAGEGDLVITMGAGDVTAIGPQLVDELRRREA
ncbi:UDP-N-acetylmuramate--L-alanine ligase [Adlercreutzia faecimuris]|uniref:UDP-N-acetylmuramate--L-alanine ligase n=1 Tax=Adlercreutzia faecimuris TaxID=2897341 RepID=A0ABS9WGY0_9ACTN|nr:UDP-N-acetylmuramate--L-alanine ligase [Adlercreutzia sp. JBNU-10]MCI2241742.1 UDP-N-acetylmuramate--L-alanine ligase [Adlercreutzia sp. JBNU-10]